MIPRMRFALLMLFLLPFAASAKQDWRLKSSSYYTALFYGYGMSDSTVYQYPALTDTNVQQIHFYLAQSDRSVRWEGRTDFIQYTPAGDSQLVEMRKYDTAVGTFQVLGIHQYAYNAQRLRSSHTELKYDSVLGRNKNVRRDVYVYDSAGRLTERTTQLSDLPGLVWINNGRSSWRYNSRGRIRETVGYFWNAAQGRWLLNDSTVHTYDASDTVYRGDVSYYRNTTTNRTFQLFRTRVDSVDLAGRRLQVYEDRYDTARRTWNASSAIRYRYDTAGRMTQLLLGFWNASRADYDYRGMTDYFYHVPSGKLERSLYTAVGASPAYYQVWNYYYEVLPAAVAVPDVTSGAELRAFPQPASATLQLEVRLDRQQAYSVTVLDLQGRRLQRLTGISAGTERISIPVSELPAGSYIAVLQGDSGAGASLKFVVQH
jgi:hypothetical protein